MELNNLMTETAVCDVRYKSYEFKVSVFTEKLTPEYKARLLALTSANEKVEGEESVASELKDENAQMLADLIESWTDKDGEPVVLGGEPFPPSYENWLRLSYPMMAAFIKQITTFLGDQADPTKKTA